MGPDVTPVTPKPPQANSLLPLGVGTPTGEEAEPRGILQNARHLQCPGHPGPMGDGALVALGPALVEATTGGRGRSCLPARLAGLITFCPHTASE